MNLVAMFDGGCRMSIGIAAGAAVLYDDVGTELATRSQLLHGVTTPVAEYSGLILALQLTREHAGAGLGQTSVKIFGDAELIIRQVDGRYRCNKPHIKSLLDMVHLLQRDFELCEILELPKAGRHHKRRHLNGRADELAGACMDTHLAG